MRLDDSRPGYIVSDYPSWGAFLRSWDEPKHTTNSYLDHASEEGERCKSGNDSNWRDLGWGLAKCQRVARDGWREEANRIAEMATRASSRIAGRMVRHAPEYAMTGHYLDPAAYITGRPDCFVDLYPVATEAPGYGVVRVTVNLSVSCAYSAEQYRYRGAALLSVCMALEAAGYGVEIDLYAGNVDLRANNYHSRMRVRFKSAEHPMDSSIAAFAMCHPATLRRLIFRHWEQTIPHLSGAYGWCDAVKDTWPDGDIHVGEMAFRSGGPEPGGVEYWVIQQLSKFVEMGPAK